MIDVHPGPSVLVVLLSVWFLMHVHLLLVLEAVELGSPGSHNYGRSSVLVTKQGRFCSLSLDFSLGVPLFLCVLVERIFVIWWWYLLGLVFSY